MTEQKKKKKRKKEVNNRNLPITYAQEACNY